MMKSNTHNNNEGNRNRAALVWMMIHVIVSSFVVFIIDGVKLINLHFFSLQYSIFLHFLCFFYFKLFSKNNKLYFA